MPRQKKKRPEKKAAFVRRRANERKGPTATKKANPLRVVVLVGFMGAGKTSVGRALGQQLNWDFEDLDARIERNEYRTVREIFRESGEAEFRRAEYTALQQVIDEIRTRSFVGGKVVALGGGAFVQSKNKALLRSSGVPTIFLDAPVEELWRRCQDQAGESENERPLLESEEGFRKLHRSRRPAYLKATFKVDTADRSVEEIAIEIAGRVRNTR